jgi:PAS domain S-box-containing protein
VPEPDYRRLFEATPVPYVVLTPDYTIVAANDARLRATMTTREAIIGRQLFDVFPDNPDDPGATGVANLRASLARVMAEAKPDAMPVQKYDIPHPDGGFEERYWAPLNVPVLDDHGKVTYIVHCVEDVTGLVKTREQARRLEVEREYLERLLMAVPVPVSVLLGPEHRYFLRNEAHKQLVGDRELIGRTFAEAMPDAVQDVLPILDRVYRTGQPYQVARWRLSWDRFGTGEPEDRYYNLFWHPLRGPDGEVEGVITATKDITDQIRGEEELHATLAELKRERELREQFVLTLTHDLRTPLSAAMMAAEMMMRRGGDPAFVGRMVPRLSDSLARIAQMIQDLLDASRIKAGARLPLPDLEPCDLRRTVADTLCELSTVHGARFRLHGEGPIEGVWSCAGLRRIVENLCTNAVKYGSAHSQVEIMLCPRGSHVDLLVHNEGPAIPVEEQATLFEPFQRTRSAHAGREKGWGLGLTLVRGLAEAHGGSVHVESALGRGTTFTVSLPVDSTPFQAGC